MKFKLEIIPLRFSEFDGSILLFGFPLFGGWLPYLGFKTLENEDGDELQIFLVEWLLRGIAFVSPSSRIKHNDEE